MANKRVPDLTPITAAEVAAGDLLLLSDISAIESKKWPVSELVGYIQSAISSSSTSSWSNNSKTASYLLYQGFPNGTASYAITTSYAITSSYSRTSSYAITSSYSSTASYIRSSSYALSSSWSATSSVQLTYSSAYSDFSRTASYLLYSGYVNGTASNSLTSSLSYLSSTSSFLNYIGIPNGTASYALNVLSAISSSFLNYIGTYNGTASHAMTAGNADTVTTVTTIKNDYIFREYGPYSCDILGLSNTASIGVFKVTASANNPSLIIEAWGDVKINSTKSLSESGSLTLNIFDVSLPVNIDLDKSTFLYYSTGSSTSLITGSIITSVYLKGRTTTMGRFSSSVYKNGGSNLEFYTGSRPFQFIVKSNTDDFVKE